jgi:hypothetical protein
MSSNAPVMKKRVVGTKKKALLAAIDSTDAPPAVTVPTTPVASSSGSGAVALENTLPLEGTARDVNPHPIPPGCFKSPGVYKSLDDLFEERMVKEDAGAVRSSVREAAVNDWLDFATMGCVLVHRSTRIVFVC